MQPSHLVRVIAAIVDDRQLTLYKEDGSTVVILQGDERLVDIIQVITPILAQGPGSVAEVNLGEPPVETNPYKDFEEQNAGGKISFFKVAKSRLTSWFNKAAEALVVAPTPAPPVAAQVIGTIPLVQTSSTKTEHLLSVAAEIIKHAQPVTAPEFHDRDTGDDGESTIVAVMIDKVIGGVEKLKPQLIHSVKNADSEGITAFMERILGVADKRRHSADDLLKFLERGDLPIADDGSFIIYKVLRRKGGSKKLYVDCHTKKVTQRVGSYVCMDEKLVDPNRSNECSNGLHVARRAYVGGFGGDVCVLAKVHPEDVIAVPNYDANKMRVCGYHILFELSDAAFRKLKLNQAFTNTEEAQLLLGRALAGDHPEPIEKVRITEQNGGGVKIVPWITLPPAPVEIEEIEQEIEVAPVVTTMLTKRKAQALPDPLVKGVKPLAPKVDPKAVIKQVTAVKLEIETRSAKAKRLYEDALLSPNGAQMLFDHKKATKLGWQALGLPADTGTVLQRILNGNETPKK